MSTFIKSKLKVALGMFAVAALVSASSASAYTFTYPPRLQVGSKGTAVMELQKALNMSADTQVATGTSAGAPGHETSTFGPATKAALMKFQAKNSLAKVGSVGPATAAALNALSGVTPTPGPTQTGPVTASVSSDNPASSVFVVGQATADLAHFTFMGTGIVTNVTMQRIGVSSDSTLSNVYLFDGATRLTDAASVTNNGMITFNNAAGLFSVTGSKNISVRSDIWASATSGQTVGVKLVSFMTSGAAAATTAGISGNQHSIASATLAAVSAGTVTPSGATINPGAAQTLWQSTLNITQRDVMLKRLALRQVGSAPAGSMTNFKLFVNGTQVGSTVASVDAMGYVTFDMSGSPVTLASGSRILRVDADVVSGASRTIQLSLRQAADVDLVDSSYGVNITPTSTPWVAATALTISGTSGGTVIVSKDTSLASQDVTDNGNDVAIGRFTYQAFGEAIKLETVTASFTSSDGAIASLRNGRLLINGVQYGSTATLNKSGAGGTSYSTNYVIMPGTTAVIEIHADMYDNDGTNDVSANDTITGKIEAGSNNAVRQDSLGYTSVPGSAVTGQQMTVKTATASLLKNGSYASQTVNIPQTAYKLGSWNLSAGSTEDLNLNTLSVDFAAVTGATFTAADLTNVYFKVTKADGTVLMTNPLATVSPTSNTFSPTGNAMIVKGSSALIELYTNILSGGITATHSIQATLTATGTSTVSGSAVTTSAIGGQIMTYNSGTLTISKDGSSPQNKISAGNQEVVAGVFKFQASNDAFTVNELDVSVPSATAASAVSAIKLYDGATPVGNASGLGFTGDDADSGSGNMAGFTSLGWSIPANTTKLLTVKFVLNTIGTGAGTSEQNTAVQLDRVKYQDSTGTQTSYTTDTTANELYVYKAIPTVSVDSSLVTSKLTNGTPRQIYAFKVTASSQGPVSIKQMKFPVAWTDGGGATDTLLMDSWKLYEDGSDVTSTVTLQDQAGQDIETTGNFGEADTAVVATWPAGNESTVAAGATKTFYLMATPMGFNTTDGSVATSPDNFTIYMAGDSAHNGSAVYLNAGTSVTSVVKLYTSAAAGNAGATGANFIWSDNSSSVHTPTMGTTSSEDWANGYKVLNFDLATLGWND